MNGHSLQNGGVELELEFVLWNGEKSKYCVLMSAQVVKISLRSQFMLVFPNTTLNSGLLVWIHINWCSLKKTVHSVLRMIRE